MKLKQRLEKFSNNKYIFIILAATVFSVHIFIALNYSYPFMNDHFIDEIIKPLRLMLHGDLLSPWRYQLNYYTGTPYFLLPILEIFGSSPAIIRGSIVSFMALSSMFAFLTYRLALGLRGAVIGSLFLLNMKNWLMFNINDYTYSTFFVTLIMYLFFRWDSRNNRSSLWILSFISGFLFYFKAVVAYPVISLAVGNLYEKGKNLLRSISWKTFLTALLFFLIGINPFLLGQLDNDFEDLQDTLTSNEYSYDPVKLIGDRVKQIDYYISPRGSIDNRNCLDCFRLNFFTLLLFAAILVHIIYRDNLEYLLSFSIFFLLLLYVPHSAKLTQAIFIIPFIPLMYISALKIVDKKALDYFAIMALIILFLTSFSNFESHVEREYSTQEGDWSYENSVDGGIRGKYDNFTKLVVSDTVITNSYETYLLSQYDLSISRSLIILPENYCWLDGKCENNLDLYGKNSSKRLGESISKNSSFILLDDNDCLKDSYCGFNASIIVEEYNLSKPKNSITLGEKRYSVITN